MFYLKGKYTVSEILVLNCFICIILPRKTTNQFNAV